MGKLLESFNVEAAHVLEAVKVSGILSSDDLVLVFSKLNQYKATGQHTDILDVLSRVSILGEDQLLALVAEIQDLQLIDDVREYKNIATLYIDGVAGGDYKSYQYMTARYSGQDVIIIGDISLSLIWALKAKYANSKILLCSKVEYKTLSDNIPITYQLAKSRLGLRVLHSHFSAVNRNYFIISLVVLGGIFVALSHITVAFAFFSTIIFLILSVFKLFLLCASGSSQGQLIDKSRIVPDEALPIYSILIPLYNEPKSVSRIITCIEELEYPKEKLDVHLLLESDDLCTIKETYQHDIPSYINVLIVPDALPKTKPKAMNYAMDYIKGEYVAVYDAEDHPDLWQLRKAIAEFSRLPSRYACLQARLAFYNNHETIISSCLSMEYDIWFGYLLKGLSLLGLPVPLGGTSNHFKVSALRRVGMWDAYNVTEDADLGVRLYMCGYQTSMLESKTMEEAVTTPTAWLKQRSRWMKGFMQTFIVYIISLYTGGYDHAESNGSKNVRRGLQKYLYRLSGHFSVWIFMGFSLYSFITFPMLLLFPVLIDNELFYSLWNINFILFLMYHYISIIVLLSYEMILHIRVILSALLWPIYFFLHTLACYIAVFELVLFPFKWNKTTHSVSKMTHK